MATKTEIRKWLKRARLDIRDMEAAVVAGDFAAIEEWANDMAGTAAKIVEIVTK